MLQNRLLEISADAIRLPDSSNKWEHFLIDSGGFADVYNVRIHIKQDNNQDGSEQSAALKKLRYDILGGDEDTKIKHLTQIKREAGLVNQMAHDNVIKLFGICLSEKYFGILLELCEGGSLGTLCRSLPTDRPINLRVTTNWALQIATGMQYLVERKFLHRDLKADNVLVKQSVCFCATTETNPDELCGVCHNRPINKLHLKITDFGLTKSTTSVGNSVVGTFAWLAPEVFHNETPDSQWSEFSDVWSFGVVLWEILAMEMPHFGVYPIVVAHMSKYGQTLKVKDDWPQEWRDIMEKCWLLTPRKRPTFYFLVEYFQEYMKSLEEHQQPYGTKKSSKRKMSQKNLRCLPIGRKSSSETKSLVLEESQSDEASRSKNSRKSYIALLCSITPFLIFLLFLFSKLLAKPSICDKDYVYFNETGYCYKTSLPVVSHEDAVALCESDNATLPSIHSSQENEFLKNLYEQTLKYHRENVNIYEKRTPVWLGVRFDGFEGIGWDDGSEFDYDKTIDLQKKEIQNWKTMNSDGSWSPATNKEKASVFCKKPPNLFESKEDIKRGSMLCSPSYSFLKHTNYCYKIGFSPTTFAEATEKCAEDGAYLMSIHSQLELDSLIKFYKNSLIFRFGTGAFVMRVFLWLGLTFDSDSWIWSDGTPFDFSNWKSEFNSSDEKRWSAIMVNSEKPETQDDLWKPVGISNWFGYICKKPLGSKGRLLKLPKMPSLVVPTPELPPAGTNCPDGYELFEKTGYCYKIGLGGVHYDVANSNCVSENASLASVHSKEENDFIVNMARKTGKAAVLYTGLGFTDDHWEWTDGSPVDYTNWVTGEPNFLSDESLDTSETQTSIALVEWAGRNLDLDQWNNQDKFRRNSYVCKIRSF